MKIAPRVLPVIAVVAAILLGAGPLTAAPPPGVFTNVRCEGTYPKHLQGICTDDKEFIFWCFTDTLVKTDRAGKVLKQVKVASHHGDLCYHDGKVYVAVNLGHFNDPQGKAKSWVYVYRADDLAELCRHKVPEVFYGAGGMGYHDGRFVVIGGLPPGIEENYAYEYDENFKCLRRHIIPSGYTLMGIQTATFSGDCWWFGCYGRPPVLLKTDQAFHLVGKYRFDCALGVVALPDGSFLIGRGSTAGKKHTGTALVADADALKGLRVREENKHK